MLNVFLFYNDLMIDAIFQGTVHQLSSTVVAAGISFSKAKSQWSSFLKSLIITYVEGEPPNPTDSGHLFARKARDILNIDEDQIVEPQIAIELLLNDATRTALFVDDFIGSGEQMMDAWIREYFIAGTGRISFASLAETDRDILYLPLIATKYGLTRLANCCVGLVTIPTHILDEGYSLTSELSILWPNALRAGANDFLKQASERAGIVEMQPEIWNDFHGLALPIGFSHGVPDATMPLYWWEENGWHPLVSRW